MIHAKNVPGRFWAECMKTAAHVINRLPQPRLEFTSPFEKLWDAKPAVGHFRVFGCVCYVFVPDHLRSKFDKKAVRCIFVGYDDQRKGWKCCDPTTGRCYTSRNVVFDEMSSWWSSENVELPDSKEIEDQLQQMEEQVTEVQPSPGATEESDDENGTEQGEVENPWQTGVYQRPVEDTEPIQEGEGSQPQLRRSTRIQKPNPKYANAAVVEVMIPKEPETYEEASDQNPK